MVHNRGFHTFLLDILKLLFFITILHLPEKFMYCIHLTIFPLDDRYYTKDHEWVEVTDDLGKVGITDYAQVNKC